MGTKKTLVIDVIKVLAPTWTMILGYLVGIVITSTKGQLLFVIYLLRRLAFYGATRFTGTVSPS